MSSNNVSTVKYQDSLYFGRGINGGKKEAEHKDTIICLKNIWIMLSNLYCEFMISYYGEDLNGKEPNSTSYVEMQAI